MAKNSVLIIDDSDSTRKDIRETLEKAPEVSLLYEASNGVEGFKLLLENPVDLVICDLIMPGEIDGFKFLALKESRADLAEIPVIILTGKVDTDDKIKGLKKGAADYVTKPFDPGELIARVQVQLKMKNLQDELRSANARLAELSITDSLTHVFNRRYLFETLEKEFDRSLRYKSPLSFIMADLDHFKKINDRFGHHVGDIVLVDSSRIIQEALRKPDVLGRYGGEEFGIILPETTLKGSLTVAERFRTRVAENHFGSRQYPIRLTISLGIAAFPESGVKTPDELVQAADAALYQAKKKGRNRTELNRGPKTEA